MKVPKTWASFHDTLTQIHHQTHDLTAVMDTLYQHQIDVGLIGHTIRNHVTNVTRREYGKQLSFLLQFNPERLTRGVPEAPNPHPEYTIPFKGGIPCFCCIDNIVYQWPAERGFFVTINHEPLVFLPNIAPSFDAHFTVASPVHQPQKLDIPTLFELAKQLPDYWVVLNDDGAGATNPWHFHFQCFKADLPLDGVPVQQLHTQSDKLTINRCLFPASAYQVILNTPTAEQIQGLSQIASQFRDTDPNHRLNFLLRKTPQQKYRFYIVLRDIRRNSSLYKSGQPGYAEVGGLIALVTQASFDEWIAQGSTLYTQLLTEISVSDAQKKRFEDYLS